MFKIVTGLGLLMSLSSLGSAQSLIVNGTFETPTATPTLGTVVTPPGWTQGGTGRVDVQTYSAYGGTAPAGTGTRFAAFNDFDNAATSSISQVVNLNAGTEYDLSFLFGNFNGTNNSVTQTLQYSIISATSVVALSGTINATSSTNTNFATLLQQFSLLFTAATTEAYTVTFTSTTSATTSSDGILDNVFLTRSVPELNSRVALPLALMTVLGCGLMSRRRRTASLPTA